MAVEKVKRCCLFPLSPKITVDAVEDGSTSSTPGECAAARLPVAARRAVAAFPLRFARSASWLRLRLDAPVQRAPGAALRARFGGVSERRAEIQNSGNERARRGGELRTSPETIGSTAHSLPTLLQIVAAIETIQKNASSLHQIEIFRQVSLPPRRFSLII